MKRAWMGVMKVGLIAAIIAGFGLVVLTSGCQATGDQAGTGVAEQKCDKPCEKCPQCGKPCADCDKTKCCPKCAKAKAKAKAKGDSGQADKGRAKPCGKEAKSAAKPCPAGGAGGRAPAPK